MGNLSSSRACHKTFSSGPPPNAVATQTMPINTPNAVISTNDVSIAQVLAASYSCTASPDHRWAVLDALSPLGEDSIFGGDGAIYLWAKLPAGAALDPSLHPPSPCSLYDCLLCFRAALHRRQTCICSLMQAATMMKPWFRGWSDSTRHVALRTTVWRSAPVTSPHHLPLYITAVLLTIGQPLHRELCW